MSGRTEAPALKIGLLRLTDAAPVIVAHEFGFFAEEGLAVTLSVEPSWANVADKLAYGFLDAAVILPPLAFAITLGLRGTPQSLLIPYHLSLGGNTITLAKDLAATVRTTAASEGITMADAFARCFRQAADAPVMAVVHAYSTHNLMLRYWLASAGIIAGRDLTLSVVPPARSVEALESRRIIGFCAGAPWGDVAARAGAGATIATSHHVWRNAPEKAFALRESWVRDNPGALSGVLRALLRAAKFCDAPENSAYTAALLSRREYLDVDSHAILSSLPGGGRSDTTSVFYRFAATFPWRSHALWFLTQMARWGLIDTAVSRRDLAFQVYRPDLYRAALEPTGEPVPLIDTKREGEHREPWTLPAAPTPIAMAADPFCDGAIFDPG
ncbi:MAG: CmpA/NrtA family ABC transporter substrate-binding protein [Azospirillaceae bacterium]|nr:CmpA/NrtA family ABC transporter substrate-binding protein [Azospirillaceae bacterium]